MVARRFFLSWVLVLFSAALSSVLGSIALAAGPEFVKLVQTLESQKVEGAVWAYWDPITAAALGIKTPPGRPGQPAFDRALSEMLAYEVKAAPSGVKAPEGHFASSDGKPYFFIEKDPWGGPGRAGYLPVKVDDHIVWVNIKGIGQTGVGQTEGRISPPTANFSSHHDGSATLEESWKEATQALVADTETKTGASRVLGIFFTGRTLEYPDGRQVPLAEIIRAPLRRLDQGGGHLSQIADALAYANVSRLMKGDFVNQANMGAYGEFVDFGCFTHTCGFAPVASSQGEVLLNEGGMFIDPGLVTRKIGENLFLTLGIPEAHMEALGLSTQANAKRFQMIGDDFRKLVYLGGDKTLLDFEAVPREQLVGKLKLHEFFRDLAGNFFEKHQTKEAFLQAESARALAVDPSATGETKAALKSLLSGIYDVLEDVRLKNRIDVIYPNYASQIRQVAHFKNREIDQIVRPELFGKAGSAADAFARNKDPGAFQHAIEETVMNSRFGTSAVADSNMVVHAHGKSTEIFILAHTDEKKVTRLFSNPELNGAAENEKMWFRVTTDGWKTSRDVEAKVVNTKVGTFFQVVLPNKDFPLTWERVQLSPFLRAADGEAPRWLADKFNLVGPPLFFNQRLGLPPSVERDTSIMRERFLNPISLIIEDLDGRPEVHTPAFFKKLFAQMEDPSRLVASDAVDEFRHHQSEFQELYGKNSEFRKYVDQLKSKKKLFSSTRAADEVHLALSGKAACLATFRRFLKPAW